MSVEDVKIEDGEQNKTAVATEEKEVTKLSDDDIKWRAKYKATKSELESAKLEIEKEKNELNAKNAAILAEKAKMEKRTIEAELKASAVSAGIKDLEFVKLIDTANVKVSETGEIQGLDDAINALKTRKPEFFGVDKKTSSSTNANFGTGDNTKKVDTKSAWDYSKDDWKKNRSQFMAGRFN